MVNRISALKFHTEWLATAALISVLFAAPTRANAQAALANDPAVLAATAEESSSPKAFAYNGQFVFETLRSADEATTAKYSGWYMLSGSATHRYTGITGTARAAYTREYSYERDDGTNGAFDNPILSLSKTFLTDRDFSFSWLDSITITTSGSIGANRDSARRTFLWSNGISASAIKTLGRFSLQQTAGYTRSFFARDIRGDGTVNSPDSVKLLSLAYFSVTDKLSIGGSFTYQYAASFQDVGRSTQFSQASVDYMFTNKIFMSAGVASERSTMEPDGISNRIRFYAPESAQYFLDLAFLL